MKTHLWLAGLVLAAACQRTETPEQAATRMRAEADSARPLIEAQMARYARAAAAGNADSMIAVFTPDAVLMPPNRPATVGAEQIRALVAGTGPFQVRFRTQSLTVNGPVAIERGAWTAAMTAPGSRFTLLRDGKYLARWQKVGDEWRMAEQIWNDDYKPLM